jgi:hypothetical protein
MKTGCRAGAHFMRKVFEPNVSERFHGATEALFVSSDIRSLLRP